MKIEAPAKDAKTKIWWATFGQEDRPTPELMAVAVAKYGLDLPSDYRGTSASPYLAAATGASLRGLLNVLGMGKASRLDVGMRLPQEMVVAAVGERMGIGYRDIDSWGRDITRLTRNFLTPLDGQYLAAYYCLSIPEEHWVTYRIHLERAIPLALASGRDLLQLVSHRAHLATILTHLGALKLCGADAAATARTFAGLMLDFTGAELDYLILQQRAEAEEVQRLVGLREVLGPELSAAELLAKARSMPSHWLDSLLA